MYYEGVDNTCTALQLCGWGAPFMSNKEMRENKHRLNIQVLDILSQLKKDTNPNLDFCLIFATVTAEQLGVMAERDTAIHGNARLILDLLGFEEVFVGKKDFDENKQRHQESGDVYMFCASPYTIRDNLNEQIKVYTDLVKEGDAEARGKFPLFRLKDLKDRGEVPAGTSVKAKVSDYYTTMFSRNQFKRFFMDTYGVDIAIQAGTTFEEIKKYQNNWKLGKA